MSVKTRIAAGTGWVGISVVSVAAIQFLQLAMIARLLSPDDVARVTLVVVVFGLADVLTSAGLSNSLIQRADVTDHETDSVFWLNVIWGSLVAVAFFLVAPAAEAFFRMPRLGSLIQIASLGFVGVSLGQTARALLEKSFHFRATAVADVVWGCVTFIGVATSLLLSLGASAVVLAMSLGFFVKSLVLLVGARRLHRYGFHFEFAETRRFISFGAFQMFDGIVNFFGNNIGSFATGRLIGPAELGGYNLAFTYAVNTPARINPIITRVVFPALSLFQGERDKIRRASVELIAITGLINAPLLVGLAVVAEDFVVVVLGESWIWIVPLLRVLVLVAFFRALGNPMGIILMSIDEMRLGFLVNLIKTAVSIGLVTLGASVAGSICVQILLRYSAWARILRYGFCAC